MKIISNLPLSRLIRRNRLPAFVLLGSLLLTFGGWRYAKRLDELQAEKKFDQIAEIYQRALHDRFNTYLRALVDLRGLFAANQNISRTEFDAFMQNISLVQDFPGIRRIGYAPVVTAQQTNDFEAQLRSKGLLNYRIKYSQKHAFYVPILYAYPLTSQIQTHLLGLDLAELPSRREAMMNARDTNRAVVTRRVSMPSDPQQSPAIGIYLPVYRYGALQNTSSTRRSALVGFVFEGFRVEDLLRGAFGQDFTDNLNLKIYEGRLTTPTALLYDSTTGNAEASHKDFLHSQYIATIKVANSTWSLVFSSKPGFYQANQTRNPIVILFSGLLATLLMTAIAVQLNMRRRLSWANEEQNQRFRSLFEQNPNPVFAFDLQGNFVDANEATAHLLGITIDELLKKSFKDFVAPECLATSSCRFEKASGGTPQNGETDVLTSADKRLALNISALPIVVSGKITGVFGIAKDITEQKKAEAQNRRTQQLLDTIIDNIPVMLFVKEAKELRFVVWNKAGEELTGLSRERLINKTDCDLFNKEDADYFRDTDRRVLASGKFLDIPVESIQTDHGVRLLHTRKVPFSMDGAQYLLGVAEDITEKKRAEVALYESEARFRAIFEQAPVGINIVNLNNEPLRSNQKLLDIVGYSFEELKETNLLYDITHPGDLKLSLEHDHKIKAGELDKYSIEKRYIRKDGETVWVHLIKTTIRAVDGKPQFLIAIIEDITERKQTEVQIRKQQKLLSTIIETLPLNLFIRDQQERFVLVNNNAAATLGLKKDEMIGKCLADVFSEDTLALLRNHDAQAWATNSSSTIEENAYQLGGERYFLGGKLPLHLENEPPLLLGYALDITERKRAEDALKWAHDELEDKVRARTEELNHAYQTLKDLSSHMQMAREEERTRIAREVHDEMGGVLTAIKIDISMLKQRQEAQGQAIPPELDRTLGLIDTVVASLRRIITNLRPSILDTLGLWAALEWQLQEFEMRAGIKCSFHMEGGEYELDDDRATAIFRIFQEVLTNAAKHSQATRLEVFGSVNEEEIIIKIKDNGIGITKESRSKGKSFGILGMQERARIFNGSVRLTGSPVKGTVVSIRFPLRIDAG